jgi:hypothetical protein
MTSLRQIESNRRNAQRSSGPKTDSGKARAAQNAVRHGLTAETVITLLEDPDDYQAFELAVTADYDAETALERELVLRLASLLWRLRRATAIETGLLQIQHELLPAPGEAPPPRSAPECDIIPIFQPDQAAVPLPAREASHDGNDRAPTDGEAGRGPDAPPAVPRPDGRDVARCFLRLGDNGVFNRLGRYEAALWRQARQTIFTLEALRWRAPNAHHWCAYDRWPRTIRAPLGDDRSDPR